jgi:type I restriction enzyme S subunit
VRHEFSRITGGTTNPHLNVDDVRKFNLVLPTAEEQVEIVRRISAPTNLILNEESNLHKLRQQKHGLMHDLLTGRVRVKATEAAAA